jgi:hypothetical protein
MTIKAKAMTAKDMMMEMAAMEKTGTVAKTGRIVIMIKARIIGATEIIVMVRNATITGVTGTIVMTIITITIITIPTQVQQVIQAT